MSTAASLRTSQLRSPARVSDRFEFRLHHEAKATITAAAAALGMDASDFAREVLLERANEVLAERALTTVVPPTFFDDLLAALDEPAVANDALRKAAAAARQHIEADHLHP